MVGTPTRHEEEEAGVLGVITSRAYGASNMPMYSGKRYLVLPGACK
jgi:hypothetical protein